MCTKVALILGGHQVPGRVTLFFVLPAVKRHDVNVQVGQFSFSPQLLSYEWDSKHENIALGGSDYCRPLRLTGCRNIPRFYAQHPVDDCNRAMFMVFALKLVPYSQTLERRLANSNMVSTHLGKNTKVFLRFVLAAVVLHFVLENAKRLPVIPTLVYVEGHNYLL